MADKKLNQLIQQLENHLECWKQFNHFVILARGKKFGAEDETQFLEVKSLIIQELELVLASLEAGTPTREDIHNLVAGAPSLRFVSELNDSSARVLESQWHKIYIGWLSVLGQLKVKVRTEEAKSMFGSMFEAKKK